MKYEVNVMISNRHVHLTEGTYKKLFGHELTKKKDLNQIGQFAANETVTIKNGNNIIENVRIVGPLRSYNQVEISKRDARLLELDPPVRKSGDILNTPSITIIGEIGEVEIPGVIIANRHVHINTKDQEKYGVKDGQEVKLRIDGAKSGVVDAMVKVSDDGYFEVHLDTDDANAFLLENEDKVTLII